MNFFFRRNISRLLLICFLCVTVGSVHALGREGKVTFSRTNLSLKEVFLEIEKQTGFSVGYNLTKLSDVRMVELPQSSMQLRELLDVILNRTGYGYRIENDQILIVKDTEVQQPDNVILKGKVADDNGNPLVGVSIIIKGTSIGTVTNIDGNFEIQSIRGGSIEISYIGFISQTIVNNGDFVNVVLKQDNQRLDEVVIVGYGVTSMRKTTAAISNVKAEDIAKVPVPNITQSLAGRAPGLIVTQSGGGVNSKAAISIRGGGTPLYVIDNVICEDHDFQNLNPEDIDQMSVLKDASATAIYGARAANGIVMVKTKSGSSGKINVDYSVNLSLSEPAELAKKVDSYTAAYYVNRGLEYDGRAPQYSANDLELYKNGSDPYGHPNTDWQKVTMRSFAPERRHNLAISGGTETMKIYSAFGYYDQESIYKTNANNMQRYNFRTNLEADIKSIGLKVFSGVDAYMVDTKEPATSSGRGYYYVWSHIQNKRPMEAAYNPFGQIYSGTTDNPLLDISKDGGYYEANETSVRGNIGGEWSVPWVDGLKIKAIGSYTIANDRYKSWNKNAPSYDWDGKPATPGKPNLSKTANFHRNFNTQLLADYTRSFEVHTFGATFGVESSGSDYDNLYASRRNYVLDVDQMGAGPVETAENSSSEGVSYRRAALIGRAKYDYASRYLVEANFRHDGSDYFPKDNRWGTFFSGSLAWAVSEEAFWKDLGVDKVFDQFKIRTSYGEIGQDGIDRYSYLTSYSLSQRGAFLGGQWVPGFSEGGLVSPDITWYTTKDFNIGLDFASLNSRLSGSVDYFAKITTGYLASPSNVGYTAPLGKNLPFVKTNGESIRRGFEFVLQWKDRIGDLQYGVSGNMTLFDDRWNINPYESEVNLKDPYRRTTQVGAYTGIYYKSLGYYKNYEDILNSPKRNGSSNLMAGDLKYYDFNGDGKIDGEDQTRRGVGAKPRANYGVAVDLSYKGIFMNMLWQGATNYNLYVDAILQGGNSNYLPVIYDFQTDIWSPENTNALYPRQHASAGYNGNNNFVGSDFWLVDAYYLRLKNMSVGYDLKYKLIKELGWISKCNISFSGYNLLTFSPAKKYGFDPEAGVGSGYSYPISRVYTVSLNLGF